MEITLWSVLCGTFCMVPIWTLLYGTIYMEHTLWNIACGSYSMALSKWNLLHSPFYVEFTIWNSLYESLQKYSKPSSERHSHLSIKLFVQNIAENLTML